MTDDATGLADPTDVRSNCGVGVVMDLDGGRSHDVLADGLELLANLEHRGTTGAEADTGDGAGVLLQTPHDLFADVVPVDLPDTYAVGSVFLPQEDDARGRLRSRFGDVLADHGLEVVHWRSVPTDASGLGETALDSEPAVEQPVVVPADGQDPEAFDRDLYVCRRAVENAVERQDPPGAGRFYICSLDRQTLVYKGLLKGTQLPGYYPDLRDERVATTFAMVHARFSTNTLGAWHLAHPYRRIVHNGEFNTIQGNVNWMRARENDLENDRFDEGDLETVRPIIDDPEQSDTASVDNALELLLADGRDLPHALRMLIPEAWRGDERMAERRRDWYDFHASLVEPWDGPALVCATDGERVGAVLDRNGLRPCRYDVTADGRLVMASEAGALDLDPSEVVERDRLEPGQLLIADPQQGRIVPDEAVFDDLVDERYGEWVDREQVRLDDLTDREYDVREPVEPLAAHQVTYGYTRDELDELVEPMATDGTDPVGSMGDDTPLSVLSEYDRPLFSYFKQLFAQVSNPPLDYIREELVTSLETRLGCQRNLLGESPAHARQLVADSPILTDAELATIEDLDENGLSSAVVDVTYDAGTEAEPGESLRAAVERVRADAREAVEAGHDVVILSDRATAPDRIPVPSLLATAAVHHDLVRRGLRNRAGVVVEAGDPRTVHHVATLIGYGAGAVDPYLGFQSVADLAEDSDPDPDAAVQRYVGALEDGLLKTMAKMGIATVESYRGAQIFEAVGLDSDLVAEYFEGTENRTEGVGLAEIESDLRERHAAGFEAADGPDRVGEFDHRRNGAVHHQWNPDTVGSLQAAVRREDFEEFRRFAAMIDERNETLQTLRGLLEFDAEDRESIPLEEVEPVESIVERFSTAAMSLGSLSPEMHETNAVAMNRVGGKANTGEGGEPPERFDTDRECAVKQVASGRFGVTASYLAAADELQIKMAQGSKPGEGGHLPGRKVNETIADVRCATPGVGLISPPPQHDIYSIEDLKQLIYDLKAANEGADVNVKLVAEAGVGVVAAGCAKANADVIHVSGHSGGTGASPRTSIKHAGVPWELGLAEANQLLRETGLRSRVRLSVDGGLKTGRDVAVAALLGAEEFVFGTASLVTSGCVMARVCHTNNCPVGVATQKAELRERFRGEPEHVINYVAFLAEELREIMAALGFRTVEEMVGRVDCLHQREVDHPKARSVDLSAVLAEPGSGARVKTREQDHDLDDHLDRRLLDEAGDGRESHDDSRANQNAERSEDAIERGEPVRLTATVGNRDRAVGAMLSNRVVEAHGPGGLPENTVVAELEGTAGQSFGAFLASGVSLHLIGSANDYLGKGLSGGRVSVVRPTDAGYGADSEASKTRQGAGEPVGDVAVGNVALYGATAGEAYVNGRAGERFAVRNSGARAVVEGIGDHGCEYMTGGAVVVLGPIGRNFAAGMSGGVAYVLDEFDGPSVADRVGGEDVSVESTLADLDRRLLRRLVENHAAYTGSDAANELLAEWDDARDRFVKVMPDAYRRAVQQEGREDVRNSPPAAASGEETGPARGVGD